MRRSSRCTASARRWPVASRSSGSPTVGGSPLAATTRRRGARATKRICDLFGDEEAVIEGVVRSATSRRRGRLKILTARVADETGEIKATWFNQPWLEGKLVAGTRSPHSGPCEPVRVRRLLVRPRRRVRDGRLRTGLPGERGPRAEEAPRPPRAGARTRRAMRGRRLPGALLAAERLPLRADALSLIHRPRSLREAEVGRARLAFDELLVLRLALLRTAAARESASAEPLGRAR